MVKHVGWRRIGAVVVVLTMAGCAALPATNPGSNPAWTASWGTAQMAAEGNNALPAAQWTNASLRQVVRLSVGGTQLRVRVSNAMGREPLRIQAASVARAVRPGAPQLVDGSVQPLRFSGSATVAVPAGAELYSDPVDLPVAAGADLAVTLHFAAAPTVQTGHPGARTTSFVGAGDQTQRADFAADTTFTRWYALADVDVLAAPAAHAVVAIGDSITDGHGATTDGNDRWPDYFARRLAASGRQVGIVNAGIGGGRMLQDGIGPRLVERFERDVLGRANVTHAIVLIGVNDMGVLYRKGDDPAAGAKLVGDLQAAYRDVVARAHAKGVCVIGGTITPHGASGYYKPTAASERDRQALNAWIRSEPLFDGVADFDAALADPQAPSRLRKAFDIGDGLHPSPAGFQAMAEAVPVQAVDACRHARKPG